MWQETNIIMPEEASNEIVEGQTEVASKIAKMETGGATVEIK